MLTFSPNNQEMPFSAAIITSFICILYGANAVAIKVSLEGLGAFTVPGLRFSLSTIAICTWAILTHRKLSVRKEQIHQILIISILFTAQLAFMYLGLKKTNASRGTLLINLQPFFILFLAHLFIPGDRITVNKLLGLILGFMGMGLVFFGKQDVTDDIQIGDSLTVLAAFIWACNTVYIKRVINAFDPFLIVFYPMIFSIPCYFLAGYFYDEMMISSLTLKVLGALLYQSLVSGAFGLVVWHTMMQKYGVVSMHSFLFIMPIAGVLLGGLVLGEPISFNLFFSLLLIVLGIILVNIRAQRYFIKEKEGG
ncbi:MAG: DMT family transporter [Deltaproteobacteria bacterium]|nr:DMT family transporter [Deltaproteobacteria bacterium]